MIRVILPFHLRTMARVGNEVTLRLAVVCCTLVAALAFAQTPVAIPTVRLQGLDRLYFDHVGGDPQIP